MKIWQKNNSFTQAVVEQFTVGRDPEFDMLLARYDVQGSLAHARMLHKAGLLSENEWLSLEKGLLKIAADIEAGNFQIEPGVEDVHSQVELILTRETGEAGKKIHTGRSRNDQVAVDIKLYLRAELNEIRNAVVALFGQLLDLSEQHRETLLPGYTHLQVAMPSSFGLWFGAWAESLIDDMEMLVAAERVVNKNPLGSGAGYGSGFPLDRKMTTEILGFRTLCYNSVYAQMGRGKTEKIVAAAMGSLGGTLSRFCMDICLYMSQNFGFIGFPSDWTTGSSIMPHKKNPDVFELIRAKGNRLQALPNELAILQTNLPSGYHRDMQLTKEILFPAIQDLKSCLGILHEALKVVSVRENILADEKYRYIFSVEAVNNLVKSGYSFREAYVMVGNDIENGIFQHDKDAALNHTHAGSLGNLCTEEIRHEMNKLLNLREI
ncbi:MAG: argininosuccinate lyase [Bacteroidota bacterium]|jgi:argininosuccinate lyase